MEEYTVLYYRRFVAREGESGDTFLKFKSFCRRFARGFDIATHNTHTSVPK